jgi:hypothetical protein
VTRRVVAEDPHHRDARKCNRLADADDLRRVRVRDVVRSVMRRHGSSLLPDGRADVIDLGLESFQVLGVDTEDPVLGSQQQNRLEHEL